MLSPVVRISSDVVLVDCALERLSDFELPLLFVRSLANPDTEVADDNEGERAGERLQWIRERAELVAVDTIALHEPLDLGIPVPSHPLPPEFVLDRHGVGVAGVGGQARDRAVIRAVGQSAGDERTRLVEHFDPRRPVRIRAASDRLTSRWMHPLEILIVDQFGPAAAAHFEIERAPGNQRGLMGEAGKVDVRFRVELRHRPTLCDSASDRGTTETQRHRTFGFCFSRRAVPAL